MGQHVIVLGPNNLNDLLKEATTAIQGTTRIIYRIQIEFTTDDKTGDIIANTINYYPMDKDFVKILSKTGSIISKPGCPYPPDCSNINFGITGKTIDDFADCKKKIDDTSDILGIR